MDKDMVKIIDIWEWDDSPQPVGYKPNELLAQRLFDAGYRLDPYPNGKSKPELIARIEALEEERDKTRNLLSQEHESVFRLMNDMPYHTGAMRIHREGNHSCPVCTFLAATSTVKP